MSTCSECMWCVPVKGQEEQMKCKQRTKLTRVDDGFTFTATYVDPNDVACEDFEQEVERWTQ